MAGGTRRLVAGLATAALVGTGLAVAGAAGVAQATTTYRTVLTKGQHLNPGQSVSSPMVAQGANGALNHYWQLTLLTNGNLVEYLVYPVQQSKSVFWETATTRIGSAKYAEIGEHGNLNVFDTQNTWTSGTADTGVTKLVMGNDGNMLLETADGTRRWGSRWGLCSKLPIANGRISSEISAGCREVIANTWYAWDAGHAAAPGRTHGYYVKKYPASIHDGSRIGFDCSGLTRWEFYLAAGHDIPGGANSSAAQYQWAAGMDGTSHHSRSGMRLGDFLYFGSSPAAIHHTAIYLGDGYILEAPYSGAHVRVAPLSWHDDLYGYIHVFTNA